MFGKPIKLLIDHGNTNMKYCLVDEQSRLSERKVSSSLEQVPIDGISEVVFATVAGRQSSQRILDFFGQRNISAKEVRTEPESFGVQCAYDNYQTLGVDRWLAILAADAITHDLCAIVDAGTAMTVDFLHNKQHLGGWIAPGFDLMKRSLTQNTDGVFSDENFPSHLSIGKTTEECLNFGCLANTLSLIDTIKSQLSAMDSRYQIFLTGGGARAFNIESDQGLKYREKLVFEGLMRFL